MSTIENKPDARRATKVTEYLKDIGWELCDLKNLTCKPKKDGTPVTIPKTGIVEYHACRNKNRDGGHKAGNFATVTATWDSSTGIVYGIPLHIGSDGKSVKFQGVIFDNVKILDLSIERDRKEHYILLHSHLLENGVNYKPSPQPPIFRLIDKEADSHRFVETRKLARQAEDLIEEVKNAGEITDFGLIFGINPSNSPIVIERMLCEIATNTPKEIITRYNDPSRKVYLALKTGLHFGLVEKKPDGVFYGGVFMGVNEATAVEYLKQNPNALSGLDGRIHELRNPKAVREEVKKPVAGAKKSLTA